MSRLHCLFDSSAFIKHYNKREEYSDLVDEIFRHRRTIAIYLPNVCIPEIRRSFFRAVITKQTNRIDSYVRDKCLKAFVVDIESYRIAIHNVTHRNIKLTQQIFRRAFRKDIKCSNIDAIDAVVISSAIQLSNYLGKSFRLITGDEAMAKLARSYKIIVWELPSLRKNWILEAIKRV